MDDFKRINLTAHPLTFKDGAATGTPGVPNMKGKRIVVVGGSGGVGSHLVDRFAASGASVIIASRTDAKGQTALKEAQARNPGTDISVAVGDTSSFEGTAAFAAKVRQQGEVDHVAVSVGGWWSGHTLWDVPEDIVKKFYVDIPTAYLANLKAWAPHLPKGNAIVWILGASGIVPVPGSGPISMGSAALVMAQQVTEVEIKRTNAPFRLFSLVNGPINTRQRGAAHGSPAFVDGDEIADLALTLMERREVVSQGLTLRSRDQLLPYFKQLGIEPHR